MISWNVLGITERIGQAEREELLVDDCPCGTTLVTPIFERFGEVSLAVGHVSCHGVLGRSGMERGGGAYPFVGLLGVLDTSARVSMVDRVFSEKDKQSRIELGRGR